MLSRSLGKQLSGYEPPFYLYDITLLKKTLQCATAEAKKYGYHLHYAIKANFDDTILSCIREYGFGIDCASGNEIKKAIEAGFSPSQIVYAGVGKRDKELRYAIETGIQSINCESLHELKVIDEISAAMNCKPDIALRINPDIDPKTNHCIDTGQADSKFGIPYDDVLDRADEILAFKNVNIMGVHVHIGSQIRQMHVFESLCERVNVIVESLTAKGFDLKMIDMGGGLGINYDMPEKEPIAPFGELFALINKYIHVDNRSLHFEFGRAIVGQCGELITKVLYNKTTATGRRLLIVDASMTELIRPALYGSYHNIENITSESKKKVKYTIAGTACESTDIFAENVSLPESSRGDLLAIKSAGAYGMSMASRYNLHDLPGAVYIETTPE